MKKFRRKNRQVAALPYRRKEDGSVEVLLVTSRETGRWVVPKGGLMKGKKRWEAAAQEAFEEAGIRGVIDRDPCGEYTYWKRKADHFALYFVDVFPLEVREQLSSWPEQDQRIQAWFETGRAADSVIEPALAELIRRLPETL
jgi:8-oxo-dGTP pyrophosphatase MutT (NUDIX family)